MTALKSIEQQVRVKHYENLAKKILGEVDGVITLKIRELKDELTELREGFRTSKPKQSISGCKTWDKFCTSKLHRTKRAVNLLLAEKSEREETSHSNPRAEKPERTIAEVDTLLSVHISEQGFPQLEAHRYEPLFPTLAF